MNFETAGSRSFVRVAHCKIGPVTKGFPMLLKLGNLFNKKEETDIKQNQPCVRCCWCFCSSFPTYIVFSGIFLPITHESITTLKPSHESNTYHKSTLSLTPLVHFPLSLNFIGFSSALRYVFRIVFFLTIFWTLLETFIRWGALP